MATRRTSKAYFEGPSRTTYAYIDPAGRLDTVVAAENAGHAWIIATGWGDKAEIDYKRSIGWRIRPCVIEWEEPG